MPERMRAAHACEPGPATAIQAGELPVPGTGPAEVLVAVEVEAACPADTFVRSGQYAAPVPFPYILGRDLAGEVVTAAPCAPSAPGDQVWVHPPGP